MAPDESILELHDRSTRGGSLSAQERAQLERWYADQDRAEAEVLARTPQPDTASHLRADVDNVLAQLVTVAQQIQS